MKHKQYESISGDYKYTHYIDVRQGAVIHLLVNDNDIIVNCYEDNRYNGRLKSQMEGLTLEQAKSFIKDRRHIGVSIKPI